MKWLFKWSAIVLLGKRVCQINLATATYGNSRHGFLLCYKSMHVVSQALGGWSSRSLLSILPKLFSLSSFFTVSLSLSLPKTHSGPKRKRRTVCFTRRRFQVIVVHCGSCFLVTLIAHPQSNSWDLGQEILWAKQQNIYYTKCISIFSICIWHPHRSFIHSRFSNNINNGFVLFKCSSKTWQWWLWTCMHNTRAVKSKQLNGTQPT